MWCVKRSFFVFLFFLSGCAPLITSYPGGVQDQLGRVFVLNISGTIGQYMRLRLLSKLPASKDYLYTLEIGLSTSDYPMVVSSEGLSVRGRMTTKATYVLRDRETQEVLTQGEISSHGSYGMIEKDFFSVTSVKKFTEESNVQRLTNHLIILLAAYFKNRT